MQNFTRAAANRPVILVLFAHPNLPVSRVNRRLLEAVSDLPTVQIHDLLEAYPDFYIDVQTEQRRLQDADLVVLQYPLYWYGPPAIIRQWMEVVLSRGFAYGEPGNALVGKDLLQVLTTGALADAYRREGRHCYKLAELLRPTEQTARFCGMHCLRPFVVFGGRSLAQVELDARATAYRELLAGYPETRPPVIAPGELWEL